MSVLPYFKIESCVVRCLAEGCESWLEKPGGPGGTFPLRAPLISLPGWDLGDQYIMKMGPFYFSSAVFQQLQ